MFSKIQEILSKFHIKKSASREIADVINEYFKDKNIIITGVVRASLNQGKVIIGGDPYVASYVKLNRDEILSYLQKKIQFYKITEII